MGRVWLFASDRPLLGQDSELLLGEVDRFLGQWKAHGKPLRCAREWRDDRFLAIGIDPTEEQASGCSIDGLFRSLKALQPRLGASLVTSGLVFYRDKKGRIQSVDREAFTALGDETTPKTKVFDPTVTTLGEWRARFELNAEDSWHAKLIGQKQPA